MSFGLPTHLATQANSHAIADASQWGGVVCLSAALATVLLSAATGAGTHFGAGLWPTVIALLPMLVLLVVLRRLRTVLMTVLYLAVGAFGTLLYALTLLTRTPEFHDTRLLVFALPVIAMIAVGGAGSGALAGVLWSTLGYVLGEAAVLVAATIAGRAFLPDLVSLLIYVLLVSLMTLEAIGGSARHTPQAMIHRAVRDVHLWQVRHQLAVQFASDLHDEALSDLIAIASTEPGALPPLLRRNLERDLADLGRDATGQRPHHSREDGAGVSEVHRAVEQSRDDGLSISVSGDSHLLDALTPEQDRALGLAVRQCLVNVLRHAGTSEADLAISGAEGEVSIMVVDAGRGFRPEASVGAQGGGAPGGGAQGRGARGGGAAFGSAAAGGAPAAGASDRLGLRASVRERIEAVGGTVTIWSNPGVGTTVLLTITTTDARR